MDAASNRGINEVKELIKESSLLPLMGGYRVYIIDEAHMITTDGFNALLKTLEEPPETVIFILATTNLEKVPKTIQSRCVLVQFGSANKTEIVHMLQRIKKQENIQVEDDVLGIIADYSDQSFRDAAKIFEELVMSNNLTKEGVEKEIGVRSKHSFYEALQKKDGTLALAWLKEFAESGGSMSHLIEGVLSDLQNHLLFLNKVPKTESKMTFTLKETVRLMKLFNEAYGLLKLSPIASVPVQVAVVDYLS
jgi:DNA polymerase-3 subunit gamma/tau